MSDNTSRAGRRVFIVEDSPLQRVGVVDILRERGYEVVAECGDAASAFAFLERDHTFDLIMVDKQIPEEDGERPAEGVGTNLLLTIGKAYPFIGPLVLYTALNSPNLGDIQRVYQAGASALAIPPGAKVEEFIKALELVTTGHQVLSPLFKRLGVGAVNPRNQNPLDPIEYYCARLISENRGKEGSAGKWGAGMTLHIIDELIEDIYEKLGGCIKGFADLPKEKKQQMLAHWYHDRAVESFGMATRVEYAPRKARRQKWPLVILDEDEMIAI